MISLPALPFGFNWCVGVTWILEKNERPNSRFSNQGCALTIPYLPSIAEFKVLSTLEPELIIIPYCTYYSHLATTIWSTGIPTMAIEQPWRLAKGASVLADFDQGVLLVAESESEAEELRNYGHKIVSELPHTAPNPTAVNDSMYGVSVLLEPASPQDIIGVLAREADGLSVINAEVLFHKTSDGNSKDEPLINLLRANPCYEPLLVRFFDPMQVSWQSYGNLYIPQGDLGYRGVRILEIDDSWLRRFVDGLESLELGQVVVVLPMVTSVSEVRRIRAQLGSRWSRVGVTVETPAAAMRIEEILDVAEFIQIGLNDLTQYTMAWDRNVPNEERLPRDLITEPVAELVASVATACVAAGVPHTLAMDLRPSNSLALQVLSLGVKSISCCASLVKPWKKSFASRLQFNCPPNV